MGPTDDHPESAPETERCEFCNKSDVDISTRAGRGELPLCEGCDSWIARRMSQMGVTVPADFMRSSDEKPSTARQEWILWTEVEDIDSEAAESLRDAGFWTPEDIHESSISRLSAVEGITRHLAHLIMDIAMYDQAGFPTDAPSEDGGNDSGEGDGLGDIFE